MTNAILKIFPLLALAPLAIGCASEGTAVGQLHEGSKPPTSVTLTWKSDASAPQRGKISGTLPDGVHYAGRYYEVVQNVPEEVYSEVWSGSEPYWPDWPIVSQAAMDQPKWQTFAASYSGQVIATLASDNNAASIRCRFTVESPSAGLVRGGHGECKLSNGSTIQNVVLERE